MTAPTRKPSTAIQWHAHSAITESAILDMTNARQIALRTRLRNFYWLTECKPMPVASIAIQRKKMTVIDIKDEMSDAEVAEVLSSHYGFLETPEGLTIPELDEARGIAVGAAEDRAVKAGNGGRAKAARALEAKVATLPANSDTVTEIPRRIHDPNPEDF